MGKTGTDQEYETSDILEIGVGLSLMNAGVPQLEAAQLLIRFREQIRPQLDRVLAQTPSRAEPLILVLKPRALMQAMMICEVRSRGGRPDPDFPFHEPMFIWGLGDATTWPNLVRHYMSGRERELIMIGVHDLAAIVSQYLRDAPEVRRGRQ